MKTPGMGFEASSKVSRRGPGIRNEGRLLAIVGDHRGRIGGGVSVDPSRSVFGMTKRQREEILMTRGAGVASTQRGGGRPGTSRRSRVILAFALVVAVVACVLVISTVVRRPGKPVTAHEVIPPTAAPTVTALGNKSAFEPSIGLTLSQVESLFREIDGSRTVFRAASKLHGVPRMLGSDGPLYTIVEINGYPAVTDVQVVSVLETASKTTLENQVLYDSLACAALADEAAQNWCTGRILNTNSHGLVTATKATDFGPVRITVKTYQSAKSSSPPVVSINVAAA